jgi:dihydroorotate dehydrogenase (fumarate)
MSELKTTYMGLELRNPLIVGSCSLTSTADKVAAWEEAGAGAVVLKSIFEEQIRAETAGMEESLAESDGYMSAAAYDYMRANLPMRFGPDKYLEVIKACKAKTSLPIIASVNCTEADQWVSFGRKLEAAGADAVELNIYDIPDSVDVTSDEIEARHLALVRAVASSLSIPVAAKLGPFYTSILSMATRVREAGAEGLVIFNRFLQPDIDIEAVALKNAVNLSRSEDLRLPLRWTAILSGVVGSQISLTGGVHTAEDAIKALLAGATTVQLCSTLYENGPERLGEILRGVEAWMDAHGYSDLAEVRGQLREYDLSDKQGFERVHYVKTLTGIE